VQSLILTLHIIVCILLVILILLQAGKEGMGVIFDGGNASVFGAAGAGNLLTKLTAGMAVVFIITSVSYNIVTSTKKDDESTILNIQLETAPKNIMPAPMGTPNTPNTTGTDTAAVKPVADATKTEAVKTEAVKTDSVETDVAKTEAPKADASKADAQKAAAPANKESKPDTAKPNKADKQ